MTARRGLLLVVAGGVVVAVGCALTWFSAPVDSVVTDVVSVTGATAAPGAVPLLLVVAAALVLRAMTRGAVRSVIGWLGVLVWVGLLALVATAANDAVAQLQAAAADATGVPELAGDVTRTAAPWLTLAGAAVATVGSVLLALAPAAAGAPRASRYERTGATGGTGAAPAEEPVDSWDALTRGDDPSIGGSK
ncbi:MAG: Trp biosynthesis-associated membrane protein [Salana multivorans]|uniref:Trp biosynthesis-associated membrane protein n=1 Tax=Salana multivorans TaxID=120377 RepID=UPI000961A7FA|nr:Trp biosynthesis-associated membrane protein [Salana multivorans]MBN8882075.1 Trp biosynthesis-associated membrane protein [Salana multivorans]OJX94241.1 MAG: hypothetical protein BGO96_15015 [Micrococcales bacterium 73-15]